uniref:C2H2-type domain-containing protein n=1 Tax=Glossina brevipalpis TaxID=37001 RepID=A0A1A9WV84_9MUSC
METTSRLTRQTSNSAIPPLQEEIVDAAIFCEVCNRQFANLNQKKQHIRRKACRGNLNLLINPCDICGREFSTYTGLRLHQTRAHVEENNIRKMQEAVNASTRQNWTADEEYALALLEVNMGPSTTTEIINHLTANSKRSRDAIKKRRQTAGYKAVIESLLLAGTQ